MKPVKQQFNVYLYPDIIKRAKHKAIDDQLSLSDLVSCALGEYMNRSQPAASSSLRLQPIVHVTDMSASIRFYEALGAKVQMGSRDGDWALLTIGESEIGLLAHPANPEQGEGDVELCFECDSPLSKVETRLQTDGVEIVRGAGDEAFGEQLQVRAPGGMLNKINRLDSSTFG